MVSLILFLVIALAAPVQPQQLTVTQEAFGGVRISWSEVGQIPSGQTLYLERKEGEVFTVVNFSVWTEGNTPPVSVVDSDGSLCDTYRLRLSPGWSTVAEGRCTVFLPEVIGP